MTNRRSPVKIGTRTSELALTRAGMVERVLAAQGVESTLVTFTTVGDKRLDEALSAIGSNGLFTRELEAALLRAATTWRCTR
jgi:hydroxymethylbilane synthase